MANQKLIIYFDMDGVLADMQGYMDEHNIKYNAPTEHDEKVDQAMWDELRKVDHFYLHLAPVPGSIELFEKLSEKYNCQILSAEPKKKWNIANAREDKIEWVKKMLGPEVKANICFRPEKKDYVKGKHCILIDDLPQNITEWEEAGGTGILFTDAFSFDYEKLERILD